MSNIVFVAVFCGVILGALALLMVAASIIVAVVDEKLIRRSGKSLREIIEEV